jgi:hypothetical protein
MRAALPCGWVGPGDRGCGYAGFVAGGKGGGGGLGGWGLVLR